MNGTIQISAAQLIFALVGAAAISGIVTGLILALSQWREREARRKELLLAIQSSSAPGNDAKNLVASRICCD